MKASSLAIGAVVTDDRPRDEAADDETTSQKIIGFRIVTP